MGVKGNQLTGVYRHPDHPKCWFFLEGVIGTQNPIPITCYDPTTTNPPITGQLKIIGDAIIAKLPRLPQQTCPAELTNDVGYSMVLDLQHNWSSIRVVQHPAPCYTQPNQNSPATVESLTKGTAVGILEKRNDWLYVDVLNGPAAPLSYWIQTYQLYPLIED